MEEVLIFHRYIVNIAPDLVINLLKKAVLMYSDGIHGVIALNNYFTSNSFKLPYKYDGIGRLVDRYRRKACQVCDIFGDKFHGIGIPLNFA